MNPAQLRVLVLQDTALVSSSSTALLASSPQFETIARTVDDVRAIGVAPTPDSRRNAALHVANDSDVVVIALSSELARLGDSAIALGIETLAHVGLPVLLLLDFGDESASDFARGIDWVKKHVRGVLLLDATISELTAAILAANAGLVVLEPRVAEAMTQPARRRSVGEPTSSRPAGSSLPLSAREREVLALLAEGRATKNIAHLLGISSHTVKAHVESIFEKFGATTRAEAVAIGVRRGAVML